MRVTSLVIVSSPSSVILVLSRFSSVRLGNRRNKKEENSLSEISTPLRFKASILANIWLKISKELSTMFLLLLRFNTFRFGQDWRISWTSSEMREHPDIFNDLEIDSYLFYHHVKVKSWKMNKLRNIFKMFKQIKTLKLFIIIKDLQFYKLKAYR